jgi:hypothetical protein
MGGEGADRRAAVEERHVDEIRIGGLLPRPRLEEGE